MPKLTLVLSDRDELYLEMFQFFVRSSGYGERLVVICFSEQTAFNQYFIEGRTCDILLAHESGVPEITLQRKIPCVVLLAESFIQEEGTVPVVFKYQPMHELISRVLALYYEQNEKAAMQLAGEKGTKIVSFYSAGGGYGKTIAALNLAAQLGRMGRQVFYLNMETFNGMNALVPTTNQHQFSKILYYLRTDLVKFAAKLESLKHRQYHYQFDYFDPPETPSEWQEYAAEDVKSLISNLCQAGLYDVLLLDLEATIQERIIGALHASHQILWLVLEDIQAMQKTSEALAMMGRLCGEGGQDLLSKISFVLNKHHGNKEMIRMEENEPPVVGRLPYVSEWKWMNNPEQILASQEYNAKLMQIYLAQIGGGGEKVGT